MTGRKRFVRMALATGLTVVLAMVLSNVVQATIVSTSGQVTKIAPPPSVELHMLESNTTLFAFDERQCVTLAAPLKVNISAPGTYKIHDDLTPGKIPAGTLVSSHFVQADRVGTDPKITLEGNITVDAKILGIITTNSFLGSSDFLGAIGTVYPTGSAGRAMQFNGTTDFVVVDPGLLSVTIHAVNSQHADQVRVITECRIPPPPPPPPPGGNQGCTPGYWKQDQHFDSWEGYLPTDSFNTVFGISGPFSNSLTLLDALGQGGGGIYALGRHAAAALLDSASSGVDYGLTTAEVIQMTKDAYNSADATQIEGTKNVLSVLNEKGCPLN